jgi:hypothetical protein
VELDAQPQKSSQSSYSSYWSDLRNFCSDCLPCHISFLALHRLGLKIALADVNERQLEAAGKEISAIVGDANVLVVPTDVSKLEEVIRLRDKVYEAWGEVRL